MRFLILSARLPAALIVACALSACGGGGSDTGGFFSGFPGAVTPAPTPAPQPDTTVKPEMRCAP
jgi:hypothetical protein